MLFDAERLSAGACEKNCAAHRRNYHRLRLPLHAAPYQGRLDTNSQQKYPFSLAARHILISIYFTPADIAVSPRPRVFDFRDAGDDSFFQLREYRQYRAYALTSLLLSIISISRVAATNR